MTQPAGAQAVCPFLGLPDDPASRFWLPDAAHRCWAAAGKPTAIDLAYQSARCMTDTYPSCVRFQARENPLPFPGAAPVMAAATTRPALRAPRGRRATRTRLTLLTGAFAVMVLLAAAVLMISGFLGGKAPAVAVMSPSPHPAITLGPTPTPLPTASPSPTPLATPTASPSPSPTPTPAPTPSPAPTPTPTPTPIVHTVVKGETLRYIARLYGVTVQDIMTANGLTNPNRIYIGQELLIPVK